MEAITTSDTSSPNKETKTGQFSRPPKPSTREIMHMRERPDAFSWVTIMPKLEQERLDGKTIVVTNGHFVLFHTGHSTSFEEARTEGETRRHDLDNNGVVLLAIVNADHQTQKKDPVKGAAQRAVERAGAVLNDRHTDYVVISQAPEGDGSLVTDFTRLAEAGLMEPNGPNPSFIYVKGGDYNMGDNIPPEARIVMENGGTFVIVDRVGQDSTSAQVFRMLQAARKAGMV